MNNIYLVWPCSGDSEQPRHHPDLGDHQLLRGEAEPQLQPGHPVRRLLHARPGQHHQLLLQSSDSSAAKVMDNMWEHESVT